MKYMISFQCDTVEEAKAVVDAVAAIGKQPTTSSRVIDETDNVLTTNERPNINPGTPLIGKIGTSTLEVILGALKDGQQMPMPKYEQHMKLLWSRGKVKFDGKEYYLP